MQRRVPSEHSLALSVIPTDAWLVILSKLDAKNSLTMATVSSFFTSEYNLVLTSMKLRLSMDTNNLKHLVHVERARHGMHLVAWNNTNDPTHHDIILSKNDPTTKCLVGRKKVQVGVVDVARFCNCCHV